MASVKYFPPRDNNIVYSCSTTASIQSIDTNFEYHFSMTGTGIHYVEWPDDDDWNRTYCEFSVMIDSHLPFYIKRYNIPVYYYKDGKGPRIDTTIETYAIKPYLYRSGGIPIGTANYRLRAKIDGHYRDPWGSEGTYGNRDMTIKFDDIIINPCNSSNKSKWSSNDGSYLDLNAWYGPDPHISISDNESYVYIFWFDNTELDPLLASSPFDVRNQPEGYYQPLRCYIGEIIYGECPTVDTGWSNYNFYYNSLNEVATCGINFGNNPFSTGTYNEYRTYIEQNFGG